MTNLPALAQIGFTANRRLLGVQTISHNPIRGAQAFTALTAPLLGLKPGDITAGKMTYDLHLVAGCGCRAAEPGLRPVGLFGLPVLRP